MGRPINKHKLADIVAIYNAEGLSGSRIVKQKGST